MEQRYHTYLPGWEILEPPIGSGGFSTVYEIVRTDEFGMEEHAALKVISVPENKSDITAFRDDGLDDKSITAYFKTQVDDISKEFFLLSGMKGNSHIVSYEDHQIVQHDNDPGWDILIRMELLASLTDYYRANFANTAIDEMTVIKIGVDLCKALELCEKKNIIHRDIKPQNIFVNQNGDFKLGDFGIARVSDHTTKATKAGTYTYMAPEVYLGRSYNAKVDQYSLGLVLYWLLNERRMPFAPQGVPTADENSKALQRRMAGEPIPEPLHGSPELKKIVLRACAFDPADRFSGPEELRCALEIIAHGGVARWFPGEVPVGIKREKRLEQKPEKEQWDGQTVGKYSGVRANDQVKRVCRIAFLDENETVLSERECVQGETFDVPVMEDKEDAQYFYQFAGWKPKLESRTAEKDVTYTAQYEKIKKKKRWLVPAACGAAALVIAIACILGSQFNKLRGNERSENDKQDSETIAVKETKETEQGEQKEQEAQESLTLASLSLNNDSLKLFTGRKAQLSVTATPAEYPLNDVEWSSSDTAVATVDSTGLVTAKGEGRATVTAKEDGKTVACQIRVEGRKIEKIKLDSSSAKKEYFVGEAFDTTGLKATIEYNTGDEELVVSGFAGKLDSSVAGVHTVIVYYKNNPAGTYSVTVKKVEVSSIRIVDLPNVVLSEGESLDMSGLEIEASYSDGSTKNIYAGDRALSCSPTTFQSDGAQDVTVSYGGKTASFTVWVYNTARMPHAVMEIWAEKYWTFLANYAESLSDIDFTDHYALYDITGDGIPELFLMQYLVPGSAFGDYFIYTVDYGDSVALLGQAAGSSFTLCPVDGSSFMAVMQRMFCETVILYTYENGMLHEQRLLNEVPVDKLPRNASTPLDETGYHIVTPLQTYLVNDPSGLTESGVSSGTNQALVDLLQSEGGAS